MENKRNAKTAIWVDDEARGLEACRENNTRGEVHGEVIISGAKYPKLWSCQVEQKKMEIGASK